MKDTPPRVVVWFSCGATSAVAAKIALEEYAHRAEVIIAYCDVLSTEHPDNQRFLRDCEEWFGQKITLLRSNKYKDTWDVFNKTGWLVGPGGARCTTELKKKVRQDFQRLDDLQVFGFDSDEPHRASRFKKNNPEIAFWAPLVEHNITKGDALWVLQDAGIDIPAMYKLGYRNNNCIGCVKGGMGYWNKIRKDFPGVFERMARQERKMDVAINSKSKTVNGKRTRIRVFLDELDPKDGQLVKEPDIECGVLCVGLDDGDDGSD